MAATDPKGKLLPLHDLKNVNTVLGMLYDADGKYRAGFKPEEFYDTILLDTLKYGEENFVHLKYAETINVRRGAASAKFRRWAGLTPTITPLKEGVPPAPDKHAMETLEVGNVFSFGRWSEYTDRIDLSVVSDVIAERSHQYGEVANQTKELYARKTWLSSPNEYFANFKEGFNEIAFGDEILLDDLRFLVARMKRMRVKAIGGKFNYICSPEFINGLIDDPRVKRYMEIEQTTGKLWGNGEPFDLFELSFIPTMLDEFAYPDTEYPGVYEASNGEEIIRLYTIADGTIYYLDVHQSFAVKTGVTAKNTADDVIYLNDGTAVENHVSWDIPTDSTTFLIANVSGTGEATDTKFVLTKSTIGTKEVDGIKYQTYTTPDAADKDADIAVLKTAIEGGMLTQVPVHRGILFGDEALIKINVEGLSDTPQIHIKALGSSGVGDPINQRQSVGFKVDGFGLAIKRPEAIVVTYSIPKNAEFAALTSKFITGDPTLLDDRQLDDDFANHITSAGHQALRIDGDNLGGFPGQPAVKEAPTPEAPVVEEDEEEGTDD